MTVLGLGDNNIGDVGATAIANALAVNASLTTLILNENNIRPSGATAIAKALEVNASLTDLRLYHNQIGDAGATALGNARLVGERASTALRRPLCSLLYSLSTCMSWRVFR